VGVGVGVELAEADAPVPGDSALADPELADTLGEGVDESESDWVEPDEQEATAAAVAISRAPRAVGRETGTNAGYVLPWRDRSRRGRTPVTKFASQSSPESARSHFRVDAPVVGGGVDQIS